MSNQSSTFSISRSFSLCTPFLTPLNPYTTTLRPFFPFQHNLLLIPRRSRRRSSSLHLTLAAQSSSDIVLIATTEHGDGSLVFRFGDASEVVEKERIESESEQESSVVKVLDGDLIEVVDGIRNADIDSAESETDDLRDSRAESSETSSDVSEKEVLLSQSDAKVNSSVNVAESAPDEAKVSDQLDQEESPVPTINFLDKSLIIEKSADPEGTLLKDSEDKTVDPSISVELESAQVQIEVVDDLEQLETEDTTKNDTEDIVPSAFPATMQISDTELTGVANKDVEEDLKDTIDDDGTLLDELLSSNALEVQLVDAVNEDVEEESQDMNINEANIIGEMSSSDQLVVEPTSDEVSQLQYVHVKDQIMEDELQQVSTKNREEGDVADAMPVSHIGEAERMVEEKVIQPQSIPFELKPTIEIQSIDPQDIIGQNQGDGVFQAENEIKDPLVFGKLETIKVSDNEVVDATQPYTKDEVHMVESKDTKEGDTKESLPPATMLVSDVDMGESLQDINISEATVIDEMPKSDALGAEPTLEVSSTKGLDVKDVDTDRRLQDLNTTEGNITDEMPTSDPLGAELALEVSTTNGMDVKDVDTDGRLQDVNTSKGTFIDEVPSSDLVGAEPALEVSSTKGMDVKDVDLDERLQDMNISEGTVVDEMSTSDPLEAEPALKVSTTKGMDVKDVDLDERLLDMNIGDGTFIDEIPTSDLLGAEPALDVSIANGTDVKDVDLGEWLEDTNISEATVIDENPKSDPLGAEPTLEVLTTKGTDVKDVELDESLQDMNISASTFIDEIPTSDHLGAEPALEVSNTKGMDVKDVDLDKRLQDMNISEGTVVDEMSTSDRVGAEPALEVSSTKGMVVKDVDLDERLQDMNNSEGTSIDEMPKSVLLGAEPALEVSITSGVDVMDLAVEDELQLVSNDNMDENETADVMPPKPILVEEVCQPHLAPSELKATMKVSDIKVQDATCQNLDDEILQVIDEDAGDCYTKDVEQSSHQLESQPVQDERVNHGMLEQWAESEAVESSFLVKQSAIDPLLVVESTEVVVGSSELVEASKVTTSLLAAEAEVEREEIYLTDDFLISGAALLEHSFKALTGGDDAYFVAGSKWLGVANGVSQWSFEGTDPGVYAQELMKTCEKIVLDASSVPVTNPVELLCRGVKETKMSGSSNVLIANFNGQALHVANIGDTGFLIIRHGAVFKKSSPLLHEFHFALQVEDSDDPLQLVEEHLIELEVGDIVVSATDGLFDNLYEREITMIVSKSLQVGMKPQEIAKILATRAQEVGKSAFVRSPFSDAAQAAGYTGYAGGKPDNVAVIVSLVEKTSNLLAAV